MTAVNPLLFLDPTMTTLIIGPWKCQHSVNKALLVNKLGYFTSAYNNANIAEAISNRFEIDDVPEAPFKSMVSWLYTGQVFLDPGHTSPLIEDDEVELMDDLADEDWLEEDDEYSALMDVEEDGTEIDYEYREEDGNTTDDEEDDEQEHQDGEELDGERSQVREAFRNSRPSDLDEYQLDVLIKLNQPDTDPYFFTANPEYLDKWKAQLEQIKEATKEAPPCDKFDLNAYDHLIDLYILADRFDAPPLRETIINVLNTRLATQTELPQDRLLPTFQSVVKALNNLPSSSELRLWLLQAFACYWQPSKDSEEQQAARSELPQDLLLELAVTNAERRFFTVRYEI